MDRPAPSGAQPETDAEIIARCRQGSRDAFADLVHKHQRWLINLMFQLVGSEAEAEDVAQEALLTAWERLGDLREGQAFSAWLRRIAVNLALAQRRKQARRRRLTPVETSLAPDPDESFAVRQILQRMKPQHAVVLVLIEMQGLSYQEVAETLGVPVGTIRSRLHYARQRFRRLWEE